MATATFVPDSIAMLLPLLDLPATLTVGLPLSSRFAVEQCR